MSKKGRGLQAEVAGRWAALLREHYGMRHATKRIMRDFNVETRTAKSWLSGEVTPQLSSFVTAARLFGITAVLGVLFPDTDEFEKSKLRDDLAALRSQLALLSDKLRMYDMLDGTCNMPKLGELDHDDHNTIGPHGPKPAPRRRPPDT